MQPTYGTESAFSVASNLNSLANGNVKALGTVDNSAVRANNYQIKLKITANSTGVSATGTVTVYLVRSNDNSDWTDGISPSSTSDQSASIKNATIIGVFNLNAVNQVLIVQFDLLMEGGPVPAYDCPKFWTLAIGNGSGAAFAASGNAVTYMPVTY
jgi:hypothetical protein